MQHTVFNKIMEQRFSACVKVMQAKDKEYSSEDDRLHNFKRAGKGRGIDPVSALDGMMLKHIVSMWDIVDKMEEEPNYIPEREVVAEKLGDIINYLILLEALIEDRRVTRGRGEG